MTTMTTLPIMRKSDEPQEDPNLIEPAPISGTSNLATYPSRPITYSPNFSSYETSSSSRYGDSSGESLESGEMNKNQNLPREVMDKRKPYKFAYQYILPKILDSPQIEDEKNMIVSNILLEYTKESVFAKEEDFIKRMFTFEEAKFEADAYRLMMGSRSPSQLNAELVSEREILEKPKQDPYEPIPSTSKCPTPPPPLPRPKSVESFTSDESNNSIAATTPFHAKPIDCIKVTPKPQEETFKPLGPNKSPKSIMLIKKPRKPIPNLKLRFQKSPQKLYGRIRSTLGSLNQYRTVQMPLQQLSTTTTLTRTNISSAPEDSGPALEDFVTIEPEPENVFRVLKQTSYNRGRDAMIVARDNDGHDTLGIRIRTEASGYTEWMNELQVYLLPDFKHENVLEFYGWDKRYSTDYFSNKDLNFNDNDDTKKGLDENELEKIKCRAYPIRIEYWLVNKNFDCVTLRDYLRENTLSWPEMLHVAKGIMQGLHFLHENQEYQTSIDAKEAVDGFIKSTNGALKKVAFEEVNTHRVIHMRPFLSLAIIHRNLTSLNIVLKRDLTPCIWNFGSAHVIHPFQPANIKQYIDLELKESILTSQYTPPEVLQERGHLTAASMKAIDMYSSGIIFWELMSRCILPKLEGATEKEDKERSEPAEYCEPFQREFGPLATGFMLKYAVLKKHCRPTVLGSWLAGKKTNRFVQTFQDLWDQDYDARLRPLTVIDRLNKITKTDRDKRFKYKYRTSEVFVMPKNWPTDKQDTDQAPPFPKDCEPNIIIGPMVDRLPSVKIEIERFVRSGASIIPLGASNPRRKSC